MFYTNLMIISMNFTLHNLRVDNSSNTNIIIRLSIDTSTYCTFTLFLNEI